MADTDSEGFVTVGGSIEGGHATYFHKIRLQRRFVYGISKSKENYVQAANSWSASWGNEGFFKVTFDDFERLLMEHGEFVVPVGRKQIQRL